MGPIIKIDKGGTATCAPKCYNVSILGRQFFLGCTSETFGRTSTKFYSKIHINLLVLILVKWFQDKNVKNGQWVELPPRPNDIKYG